MSRLREKGAKAARAVLRPLIEDPTCRSCARVRVDGYHEMLRVAATAALRAAEAPCRHCGEAFAAGAGPGPRGGRGP